MNTSFFIARRYLFAKKSYNAINWVSGISVAGIAIATAAMICVLSVFNGFSDFVARLFTAFDPEIRVELVTGKTISASDPVLRALQESDKVAVYTEVLEENALVRWGEQQTVVTVKGVSDNFASVTNIHDILIGEPRVNAIDTLQRCIVGLGVAHRLGLQIDYDGPLHLWAPRHGERLNMSNPGASFRHDRLYSSGALFYVGQSKYDDTVILTSLGFAQNLFDAHSRVSHVELKLSPSATRRDIEAIVDNRFRVLDRYQQQADSFRVMNIEKLVSYVFLTFVLLISAFNIVGSLSMLILEKRDDVVTLRAMGATDSVIRHIFMLEGRMIAVIGALIGLVVGLLLCWLQTTFGLIRLGDSEGSFILDVYPVKVEWQDVLLVFLTVVALSCLTVIWPVKRIKIGKS